MPPVISMSSSAVSRARYFESQGVTLASPARSRSGVRDCDGVVVFALPSVRVRVDWWGSSCLLWNENDDGGSEAAIERMQHSRLAAQQGGAEGFLLTPDEAPLRYCELLDLRVVRIRREYWAKWGGVQLPVAARLGAWAGGGACLAPAGA